VEYFDLLWPINTMCYSRKKLGGDRPLTSPETVSLEALLAPISESTPAGSNLRADVSPASIYYKLKDARSSARAAERRAEIDGDSPGLLAEWQTILSVGGKALASQSKDLEVAAWVTEALVRAHGYAGLRDGLKLLRGVVSNYWDTFFSLEDEDGLATRLAPVAGLNGVGTTGTLIQPLRKVPLTNGGDDGPFAVYHYDQAWELGQVADADVRARRTAAGEVTMERFNAAVNATGGRFYIGLLADLQACSTELEGLGALLDERAGRDAPSFSDIRGVLGMVHDTVQAFSKELVERTLASDAVTNGEESGTPLSEHGLPSLKGVGGREDALRVLMQVADFFRRYEPHSPISTSLDEIVRRARMPFPELLAELLPDQTAWRSALTSAGIKPPSETSG
jgi:type VI secretion system protein ImpA